MGEGIVARLRAHGQLVAGSTDWEAANEIERLQAEVQSQTFWAELMAGNNCYCPSDKVSTGTVGVCAPCAYRQTMRQNKEIRRDLPHDR